MSEKLTSEELKYFESGGESEIEEPQEVVQPEPKQETETVTVAEASTAEVEVSEPAKEQSQKMVDIRALHEERAANRELKQRLADIDRRHQETIARLQKFEQQIGQPQQPQFEENPAEYLRTEVDQVKQQLTKAEQQAQSERQSAQFRTWYQAQAQQFEQQQPDFSEAYKSYNTARFNELLDAGLSREQAQQRFIAEEAQLAISAAQIGVNPAHLIYQAAMAKGYKPTPKVQNPEVQKSEKLQNVARGIEASKPLSSVGGGGQSENLTWEWVASVPDSEFLAAWKKMEKSQEATH